MGHISHGCDLFGRRHWRQFDVLYRRSSYIRLFTLAFSTRLCVIVCFLMVQTTVSVGASGALFGILGGEIAWLLINWHLMQPNARNQELCR
jgi:hypothetical protein